MRSQLLTDPDRTRAIKLALLERGLTQRDVCMLAKIDYTRLHRIIYGKAPTARERSLISRILGYPPDTLFPEVTP